MTIKKLTLEEAMKLVKKGEARFETFQFDPKYMLVTKTEIYVRKPHSNVYSSIEEARR